MNANKQLINLAGILIVVVLLVAGIALIALPMYGQSRAIDDQTRTVAGSNTVYEQQIAILSEASERVDEIDQALASLREQIAATPQLDDVLELVTSSARNLDLRVVSVSADDPEPWLPRDRIDEEGNAVVAEAEPAPAAATTDTPATEEDASAETADSGDGTSTGDETTPTPEQTASPQRQLLLTVTIDLTLPFALEADDAADQGASSDASEPDAADVAARAAKAADFVDALGKGPRLMSPIDVAYTDGKLVVSALTYFRTEDTP